MPTNTNNQFENEYRFLFDTCTINENKFAEIDGVVSKMVANKTIYDAVANSTNIPWNFIAIIHCMEGSLSFKKHLHNGDPLTGRTVQIPKGRPIAGNPPFTWEESAIDALTIEGFTTKTDWSIPSMLSSFEKYNGMGYRRRGIHSPYLWSFSNHYTKGKFTHDGMFDPNAVSKQCGAAVFLRRMSEKQIAIIGSLDKVTQIKNLALEVTFAPKKYAAKEVNAGA